MIDQCNSDAVYCIVMVYSSFPIGDYYVSDYFNASVGNQNGVFSYLTL